MFLGIIFWSGCKLYAFLVNNQGYELYVLKLVDCV